MPQYLYTAVYKMNVVCIAVSEAPFSQTYSINWTACSYTVGTQAYCKKKCCILDAVHY